MKHLVLVLGLLWSSASLMASTQAAVYPGDISSGSPILAALTDASSLVAHIQVTNICHDYGSNIKGTFPWSATFVIKSTLKGTLTNGTIMIFSESSAPVLEVGHDYVAFLKEKDRFGRTSYYLVDLWLSTVPFSEPLLNQVKAYLVGKGGKGEPDGAANGSQSIRSGTNRTSSAAGSRR
jgi:hypothetical protein